ncbi:hypothetical protein SAMN04488021_14430 [Paracoccus aminovorans]|uniref:Uncharacterized protein n=1 Tax=Paracoccus aminovorans TaxID=34004 RepID=A0A1I3E2A3_9RHOB|nr:hypothetical protein [Paracoccus aminovorans]CQR84653.1 hypothetical protein JCM7685_0060 [Paracoccus aminovorans]SFH93132.1 hypothetical protein SAMN04488021_14430 [Paracoccus aminovorans]
MSPISETERGDVTDTSRPADWPAQRLTEARGIVADFVHHPDSLIILACRAIATLSPEEQERREALALAGLLICLSNRKPKGGAA